MSDPISPGETEVRGYFACHLGPRFMAAGLTLQFRYNFAPGIHYKVAVNDEYRTAIRKGIEDGMGLRFPAFPGSVWITAVEEHPVDSSKMAFYLAARSVIDQAYSLAQVALECNSDPKKLDSV